MSEMQELIHRTTMIAYEKGKEQENIRIIKLIENERLVTSMDNMNAIYDKLVFEGIREQLLELIRRAQK
jgi:hypothetical protein